MSVFIRGQISTFESTNTLSQILSYNLLDVLLSLLLACPLL